MRVLAVEHTGGIDLYRGKWEWLCRHADVDLTVLAPETWIENYRLVRTDPRVTGYRILTGKVAWRGYENRGFFYTGLLNAIRATRPDILHLVEDQFSLFAFESATLCKLLFPRVKILFYTFDNVRHGFRYPYRPSWAYGLMDRRVQRLSDCGVVGCSDARTVLLSRGFTKPIRFVPLALDPQVFRKQDAAEPRAGLQDTAEPRAGMGVSGFVVGFAGRLLAMKGVHLLADALERLKIDWTWLVVGSGPERDTLLARAHQRGWGDRLRIIEAVPHAEMPALINLMDVLVLPSISTPRAKEQFGRTLIEAMACEVPVIGSNSGSIPEVIGRAGLITPEGDAPTLAAALENLAANPELRTRLAAAGRRRVLEHFTWEKVAAHYKTIYDGLLSGRLDSQTAPPWVMERAAP